MAQPVAKPQPHQRPSVPAKLKLVRPDQRAAHRLPEGALTAAPVVRPDLTIQLEPFPAIARELPPLMAAHWAEAEQAGGLPLDPDWDRMYMLANGGMMYVLTARDEGRLVGYVFAVVVPHVYSRSSVQAEIYPFYLEPKYRGGLFILRWLKALEVILRAMKVRRIHCQVLTRLGPIFKRLGYEEREAVFYKDIV